MYSKEIRPLNDKDVRNLRLGIAAARKQIKAARKRAFIGGPIIIAVLWGLTLLFAGSSSAVTATLFWLLIGIPICIASGADAIRPHRKRIILRETALSNGQTEEIRIIADAMVDLEEVDDEGVCFAFQVDQDRIVFVCGQDFYAGPKFPNTDFSIISIRTQDGKLADLTIEKHGEKLRPLRKISAVARTPLRCPQHLELVPGKLDNIEAILKETH
ncbi:MAG: hypothetical protein WCO77_12190 [bacterium]